MKKAALRTNADFEALYDRHWKYVYRLCFTYMNNVSDAEDVTEDVFVKVITGEYTFNDEIHERKWLTVTAINLCKDRLRSYGRKNIDYVEELPEVPDETPQGTEDITDAVMALPIKYKEIIWLYYYMGYQLGEIAKMLKRPPSTVRNQIKDARNLLKKILGGEADER